MSAVRLGPVMTLMRRPATPAGAPSCQASRNTPTWASDSISAPRIEARPRDTAGRATSSAAGPRRRCSTSVPVSATARSTPVTPMSAAAMRRRGRRRARRLDPPRRHRHRRRAPRRSARARQSAPEASADASVTSAPGLALAGEPADHRRALAAASPRDGRRHPRARTPPGTARASRATARRSRRRMISAASRGTGRSLGAGCGREAAWRLRHLPRGRGAKNSALLVTALALARQLRQRSGERRAATAGRSRVRVQPPDEERQPREPARARERALEQPGQRRGHR